MNQAVEDAVPSRGVALLLRDRLGLANAASDAEAEALHQVTAHLEAALEATTAWLADQTRLIGLRNEDLEDEELEVPWRDPDDPLPFGLESDADAFLERRPQSAAVALEAFLRRRLRKVLATQAEMVARAGGRRGLLRGIGADERQLANFDLNERLQEALERRPLARRLERLLVAGVDEIFLLALTWRFEAEEPGGGPEALGAFLRAGVERCWQLTQRLDGLGHASRWAHFRSSSAIRVADLEGVEAAIAEVEALVARLAAEGTGFQPPEQPRRRRGAASFRWSIMEPHWTARHLVEEAVTSGDDIRLARAQAGLARSLATSRRYDGICAIWTAELEEAIRLWRSAMEVWTRQDAPRKWGALMHNVALAEEALARTAEDGSRRCRAALDSLDAALEALDPAAEPWCHAAAWWPRLRIADRLRQGRTPEVPLRDDT